MSHYDLNRMGWQQFEQMIQSLATVALGYQVRSFGTGSDGQRDATFDGEVNFTSGDVKWDGYGVIQAKYREKPVSTTDDWKWFLDQVRKELRGWNIKKDEGKKTPQFLLFATNVALTGTETVGGKDQFDELMSRGAPSLGLRGWFVWDYDQIRSLLDIHLSVRQTYLEKIITGDFLANLERLLSPEAAFAGAAAAEYAVAELTSRQWVRTGDSGYSNNSKLRLADIAIDLPCEGKGDLGTADTRQNAAGVAVSIGDRTLVRSRIQGLTLVGGPGQGKSTLAQLIAHNYRVAFLRDTDVSKFGDTAVQAFTSLRTGLAKAHIAEPVTRRWPVVIELAKAGAEISGSHQTFSFLKFISESILVKGVPVSVDSLLSWFKSWPVCLVLDGLDEVPNTSTRARLIEAVTTLITELNSEGIDLLIVATTRPQGYHDDFDEAFRGHRFDLVELTEAEALSYSETLTAARTKDDPLLAEQVTERLIGAVHERITQKLMTTPLQVTIMTALAEESLELPSDRFELFDRYYKVVYDRELSKRIAADALRRLRPHVNYLHEWAGLKLHRRSEQRNASDAMVTRRELGRTLRARLENVGFESSDAESKTDELLQISMERLVLLVSRRPNKFEFEVRSLQEYMAARAITDPEDKYVLKVLKELLPSDHWRNTWLLAAGRVLKSRPHLKEELVKIVVEYDRRDAEAQLTLPGASLAADLFVDNFAIEYPALRRSLLSCSVRILADTSSDYPQNLSQALLAVESDGEKQILLEALTSISEESPSNLASKYLHERRDGASLIARLARAQARQGRNYIKPREQDQKTRIRVLAEQLERRHEPSGNLAILAGKLREEANDSLSRRKTISPGLLDTLSDPQMRELISSKVREISILNPDVAAFAVALLRLEASSRAQEFETP